jgi:hypothetical protein
MVWKYQPGLSWFFGVCGDVIRAVLGLDPDLPEGLEAVGAEVELRARGEENVPVLEDVAEDDAFGFGERKAVRPGVAVVLGEKDLPLRIGERLVPALRINVPVGWRQAIPEVLRRRKVSRSPRGVSSHSACARQHDRAAGSRHGTKEPASSHSWRFHHVVHVVPLSLTGKKLLFRCFSIGQGPVHVALTLILPGSSVQPGGGALVRADDGTMGKAETAKVES